MGAAPMGTWEGTNGDGMMFYRVAFAPQGSSDPTVTTTGRDTGISSIKRKTTGIVQIQLTDTAPGNFLGAVFGTMSATSGNLRGWRAEIDYSNSTLSSGLIGVALLNTASSPGTPADVTASTNEQMYCWFIFSKNPLNTN